MLSLFILYSVCTISMILFVLYSAKKNNEARKKVEYLENLKLDILSMSENVISSYSLPSSTDVDYFSQDGYDWAKLYCNFNIRKGTDIINTVEQFLLRKDENGRWKIYGWKLVEE